MNTTNLFVELIVIGAGVFIWVVLLVFSFVGFNLESIDNTLLLGSAIPVMALIYVSGIISDRFADNIFGKLWGDALRTRYFNSNGDYYNARRNILTNSESLSELLEYGRSRLRICRGWSINALLIGLALNLFIWRQGETLPQAFEISLIGTCVCLALSIGSWYSWRNLTEVEYRKIKDQSEYLSRTLHNDA